MLIPDAYEEVANLEMNLGLILVGADGRLLPVVTFQAECMLQICVPKRLRIAGPGR